MPYESNKSMAVLNVIPTIEREVVLAKRLK
jgi:hypothetical protein